MEANYSRESEIGMLGSILLSPAKSIEICEGMIKPEYLFCPGHRALYETIAGLHHSGTPTDIITLTAELQKLRRLAEVGGAAYLAELQMVLPTAANLPYYLEIIVENWHKRELVRVAQELAESASLGKEEMIEASKEMVNTINGWRDKIVTGPEDPTDRKGWFDLMDDLENRYDKVQKGELQGIPTGIRWLDQMSQGLQPGTFYYIGGLPSEGKAQPMDANILTPSGFRPMGSLNTGDFVIGLDGRPTQIVAIHPQGIKPIYRVTLTDGTSTECCEDHLWHTQTRLERIAKKLGSVKSLRDIKVTLTRDGGGPNHAIPRHDPIELVAASRPLEINPWVLGALLGDGKLGSGNIAFCNPEIDVMKKLHQLLPDEDSLGSVHKLTRRIVRKSRCFKSSETKRILGSMGLLVGSCQKFIPESFLMASPQDRISLLQGLVDTDGYIGRTKVEFTTSSPQLAKDFIFLVRSLGGHCMRPFSRIPKYTHKGKSRTGKMNWRISFSFHNGIIPCSSIKHLSKYRTSNRMEHRSIKDVEFSRDAECQCITVKNNNGLYLTDEFIVTHNSALLSQIAVCSSRSLKPNGQGYKSLIFSIEMSRLKFMERMLAQDKAISSGALKSALYTESDFGKISHTVAHLRDHIFIYAKRLAVSEIRSAIKRALVKHPDLDWIGIDYLQYITSEVTRKNSSREQEIAQISRDLNALKTEFGLPIVCCAALNSDQDKRKDKRPTLMDFRDSKSAAYDADTALFLCAEPNSADLHRKVEFLLLKNRDGGLDERDMEFNKRFLLFQEPEQQKF